MIFIPARSANPMELINDLVIVLELLHRSVLQQQSASWKPL